jgi:hypothetical protein
VRRDAALREAEQRLRRLPDRAAPQEADAADRAWRVVEAAYAERPAPGGRRLPAIRLAIVAAIVAIGLAVALSPAGAEVGRWIEDRFAGDSGTARPAFAGLPDRGAVLALGDRGAWVVHPDGGLQWVGRFSEAGWSPRGMYVIGVRRRLLAAVTPTGTPRWTLPRRGPLHRPAWSPGDGFRVAYLEGEPAAARPARGSSTAGARSLALRVVAGDGTGDRLVRRAAALVTPAWRPPGADPGRAGSGGPYVLTYAAASGQIETVDVDTGRRLWGRRFGDRPRALAWTRDGKRLVALSARGLHVYDRRGRPLFMKRLPGAQALALHPSGLRAAVPLVGRGGTSVLTVRLAPAGRPRPVVAGLGHVDGVAWSPDGRHLLVASRDTDQWLLVGPRRRVRPLSGVSGELGAGAGFPRLAGWCCPGR